MEVANEERLQHNVIFRVAIIVFECVWNHLTLMKNLIGYPLPKDRMLLTGSFDGTASLQDLGTGDLVRTFEGAAGGIGFFVDIAPNGESVLLSLIADNRIIRYQISIESLIDYVYERVQRDLTEEERRIYGLDESPTCPKFAEGS